MVGSLFLGGGFSDPGGAAGFLLLVFPVLGEIAAERLPCLAEILSAEEHVPAEVDGVLVMRRWHHRRIPIEAVLHSTRRAAGIRLWLRRRCLRLARPHVAAHETAALRFG